MIPTHLKVLTIEEKPFVYVRELPDNEVKCLPEEIACPHFNMTDGALLADKCNKLGLARKL